MRTIWSATSTQASPSPVSTGTHQRWGARSSSNQISRIGTAVPIWPMVRIRGRTPVPSCGASRIPAVISILVTAARLVNPPRASSTASTTTSV